MNCLNCGGGEGKGKRRGGAPQFFGVPGASKRGKGGGEGPLLLPPPEKRGGRGGKDRPYLVLEMCSIGEKKDVRRRFADGGGGGGESGEYGYRPVAAALKRGGKKGLEKTGAAGGRGKGGKREGGKSDLKACVCRRGERIVPGDETEEGKRGKEERSLEVRVLPSGGEENECIVTVHRGRGGKKKRGRGGKGRKNPVAIRLVPPQGRGEGGGRK